MRDALPAAGARTAACNTPSTRLSAVGHTSLGCGIARRDRHVSPTAQGAPPQHVRQRAATGCHRQFWPQMHAPQHPCLTTHPVGQCCKCLRCPACVVRRAALSPDRAVTRPSHLGTGCLFRTSPGRLRAHPGGGNPPRSGPAGCPGACAAARAPAQLTSWAAVHGVPSSCPRARAPPALALMGRTRHPRSRHHESVRTRTRMRNTLGACV